MARVGALAPAYSVGVLLAGVLIAVYLLALSSWPEDEARALAFCALLASQPLLLLSMRSPERPWWSSGRRWTRTVIAVIAVLVVATVACVHVGPLARLLHLEPFPAWGWFAVVAAASAATWLEPLKLWRRAVTAS